VKKKDSVIMYIPEKKPDRLFVSIHPCGSVASGHNARIETFSVTITRVEQELRSISLPEWYEEGGKKYAVYGYPMVIDASEFQKVKKLTTVGKTMFIEMQASNYLSFFSDNGELYDSKVEFGEIVDDPEEPSLTDGSVSKEGEETDEESEGDEDEEGEDDERAEDDEGDEEEDEGEEEVDEDGERAESEEEEDRPIKGWWESTFPMPIFNMLLKLPGLCTQMQFFAPRVERYPLKVKVHAGPLGPFTVYIKDSVQIAYEQTKKDDERRQVEDCSESKRSTSKSKRK
jgi:hypothetical protein